MDIVKQKNLAASVAAIGLSALFLLNRYSVEGLCILGILALYLLLRTVIGAGKTGMVFPISSENMLAAR